MIEPHKNGRWSTALVVGTVLVFIGSIGAGILGLSKLAASRDDLAYIRAEAAQGLSTLRTDVDRIREEQGRRSLVVYSIPGRIDAIERRLERIERLLEGRRGP